MFRYRRRELSSHVVISYLGYTGAGKTLFPTGKGGFLMTSVEILGGRRKEKKLSLTLKERRHVLKITGVVLDLKSHLLKEP